MAQPAICPKCGLEQPAVSPGGLCPGCMLREGLGSENFSLGHAGEPGTTVDMGDARVLDAIAATLGPVPRVLLRDTDAGFESPLVLPGDAADASLRYRIDGEIARGGMGAVLKGRDPDLGRDVAVKVLLEKHRNHPELVRRFVEEAQIAGQLQHPGIVPVYELGTFADHRPFFSMKLVKGRTLADLLAERGILASGGRQPPDPPNEGLASAGHQGADAPRSPGSLPRFLSIFEAICQTVAYAHARGVIHRDLKPSNVMIGAFGEVQVMDWGLAKVLPRGGIVDDDQAGKRPHAETVIATARSDSDSDHSRAGSVMGTPAYMAPEQARGEIDQVDERADVFALGSILCEILTGQPAYTGRSADQIQRKANRGDLAEAYDRLDKSTADRDLITLAHQSLAPDPDNRPRDAGTVAERITAYLTGVQERLRTTEIARAAETARAEEATKTAAQANERANAERRARRFQVGLAASLLALVGLGAAGFAWVQQQRAVAARDRADRIARGATAIDNALADAQRLRGEAEATADAEAAAGKWSEALAAAQRADDLAQQGDADDVSRARIIALRADLRQGKQSADKQAERLAADRGLLAELETIRGSRAEHNNPKQTDVEYAAAFRKAGLDVDATEPAEAGKWLRARSNPMELTGYLDDWTFVRRLAGNAEADQRRLVAVVRAADPDPWREALRARVGTKDPAALAEFHRLADDAEALASQPAASILLLARQLYDGAERELATDVLRRAVSRHPGDFWIHRELAGAPVYREGNTNDLYPHPEEAVRHMTAAVAIRPKSASAHNQLGNALDAQGKLDEAIAEYREAIRLKPDFGGAHNNLGNALRAQGKPEEAIAVYREAIRLKPDSAEAHGGLGGALMKQGKLDEAVDEFREALRLKDDYAVAHVGLGLALQLQQNRDEALAELRRAELLASPGSPVATVVPGLIRQLEQQIALAGRLTAILKGEDQPKSPAERLAFAQMAYDSKHFAGAARLWAEALEADPKLADDHKAQHRYNAACAAALAATTPTLPSPVEEEGKTLDEASKVKLRAQALEWLKAELGVWSTALKSAGKPNPISRLFGAVDRDTIRATLEHWKKDPDLAGVRETDALEKLAEDERAKWQVLWAEVDRLLNSAVGP